MLDALVAVQDAGRYYSVNGRQIDALYSATCAVKPASRISVMGPSGSGKSTLLHLMGALDFPTSGSVVWPLLGEPGKLRPLRIGFVFQMPSLLPSLDVAENVKLPLLLAGDAERADERALEMLARLELDNLAAKMPDELSGGQMQRVSLARALAPRPRLILADEPTGQLDHPTAGALFDSLLAMLEGTDTALVVATHDAAVEERLTDKWRISHGILEEVTQ